MKLMLTSAGISNKTIEREFRRLAGRNLRIAYIPTAANMEPGTKFWLIRSMNSFLKFGMVDIVDISAIPKRAWLKRLEASNVIVVGGGSPMHLLNCAKKTGFNKELPRLLKTRLYVGISAGSVVLSKKLSKALDELYGEDSEGGVKGLGYVNFEFMPHLNSAFFTKVRDKNIRKVKSDLDVYALDDKSSITWIDGKVNVVSEGTWKKY